jgi:ADP-heptose:LPS heptosyltransferase
LNKTDAGRDRPVLTSLSDSVLLRIVRRNGLTAEAIQLPSVPRRLLAVKVHGLGDSVMVRSLLDHFHRRHPDAEIGVLAGSANRDVFSADSNIRLHRYDQRRLSIGAIVRELIAIRTRRYQAVIDFEQGSLTGAAFVRATRIPVRAGFLALDSSAKAAFLTHPLRFRETDSMWESFIRLMSIVDRTFPKTISTTPLPLDSETRRVTRSWLCTRNKGPIHYLVAFHLGSGPRAYKRWPVERFIALADRLRLQSPGLVVVVTGQPAERGLVEQFGAGYSGRIIDATVLGSIVKVAALLAECDVVVSNDTGIMHLGAAMGTPTVGIFGPVSPCRWAPVGPLATAVSPSGVACSPCAETYRLRDPSDCTNPDRMRCLREVSVDMVIDAIKRVSSERRQMPSKQARRTLD